MNECPGVDTRAFVFQNHFCARRFRSALIAAGAFAFVACASPDADHPPAKAQAATRDTAVVADVAGEVVSDDSSGMRNDQVWITDGNALALLGVMNTRQIAAADVELEAWHSDTVRAFAASVARDHAELQHSVDSLVQRIHVAPVVSALVQRVDTSFRRRVDSLRAVEGRPLELAFARQQVVAESAFATYADQLTGAATAPEVRAMMESAATRARAEADRARALQMSLMLADSIKKAAVADSIARAEERRQRRARRTP